MIFKFLRKILEKLPKNNSRKRRTAATIAEIDAHLNQGKDLWCRNKKKAGLKDVLNDLLIIQNNLVKNGTDYGTELSLKRDEQRKTVEKLIRIIRSRCSELQRAA